MSTKGIVDGDVFSTMVNQKVSIGSGPFIDVKHMHAQSWPMHSCQIGKQSVARDQYKHQSWRLPFAQSVPTGYDWLNA